MPSLAFGRAYPITCKIVNLAHVVGSVDLLRGQDFEVLTVTWDGGYQPGMLLGPLQGSSGLLTLEQFFPPGGLEGPPRRSSQGGCLTPLLSLPDCVQTSRSTDRQPRPGPDYLILKICWRSSPRVITWCKTSGGSRRAPRGICMTSSPP